MPRQRRKTKREEAMQEAPAVQTEKKSLTLDDILLAEVEACRKAMPLLPNKPRTPMRIPLEDFVKRSFMLHRHLFEKWNGWRYRGEAFLTDDFSMAEIVALQEWSAFLRQIGNLFRDKVLTSTEAEGISLSLALDYVALSPSKILAQKNLAASYMTGADPVQGQAHVQIKKDADHKLYLGRTKTGSNQYGSYGKEMWAPIRVGQRVSAAVMRCLEENDASPPLRATWEKLFQRLGELCWGNQKTPIQTTLSIAPSSFIRLGTLGENSCYRHGGEGEYSKYWLAADCPDSFVALFHRMAPDPKVNIADENPSLPKWDTSPIGWPNTDPLKSLSVCARAWGIAQVGHGAMISNFYQLPREMLMPSLKVTLSKGLGTGELEEEKPAIDINGSTIWNALMGATGCVYLNRDVLLLGDKSAKKEFLINYLKHVINHAGTFGFYTRKGNGPVLLQVNENVYRIAGKPEAEVTALWPYNDVDLKLLVADGAERGLFFPPQPGVIAGGVEVVPVPHNFQVPPINWANVVNDLLDPQP